MTYVKSHLPKAKCHMTKADGSQFDCKNIAANLFANNLSN